MLGNIFWIISNDIQSSLPIYFILLVIYSCADVPPLKDCTEDKRKLAKTDKYCGFLDTGPFKACMDSKKVNFDQLYSSCEVDFCNSNRTYVHCQTLQTAALACSQHGFQTKWRTPTFCRKFLMKSCICAICKLCKTSSQCIYEEHTIWYDGMTIQIIVAYNKLVYSIIVISGNPFAVTYESSHNIWMRVHVLNEFYSLKTVKYFFVWFP